jgi:hypothetical protein
MRVEAQRTIKDVMGHYYSGEGTRAFGAFDADQCIPLKKRVELLKIAFEAASMTEDSPQDTLRWPASGMSLFNSLFPWTAPKNLAQSILPGWIFANTVSISEKNSSAPEVESDIVSEVSYGRQLGRVIEALSELIKEKPVSQRSKKMHDFLSLSDKIERIKFESTERRLDNVKEWLIELNKRDRDKYRSVVLALKEMFDSKY